nr:protein glp-1-like [Crassostrea gigas]
MHSMWLYLTVFTFCKCYENIALHKPAFQQYPFIDGEASYDASRAVDGLKSDLSWSGGQCVLSSGRHTAIWWVNLTSILSIHHITIYYRKDNVEPGIIGLEAAAILGFSVYVSNTSDVSQGVLCFKDNNFTRSTVSTLFNITCPVHGQYVIYYNERLVGVNYPLEYSVLAYNDLCEVEVYGCPTTGYYGLNCSVPCPDVNCQYCHIETGTCQGCKPGYKGHRCDLACDVGRFGEACREKCGHCQDKNKCFHINGTCLTGCNVGYEGDLCKTPCLNEHFGQDCAYKCNNTCTNCNHLSGVCDSGCLSGWKGKYCHEACSNGSYSIACKEMCGNCHGVTQCDQINGTCLNGCKPGFEGNLCKTRKYILLFKNINQKLE